MFLLEFLQRFWAYPLVPMWLSFLAIGMVLERVAQAQRGQPLRHVLFNLRYGLVYLLTIFFLTPFVYAWIGQLYALVGSKWIDIALFPTDTLLGQVGAGLVSVAVIDFLYYWFHRAQHSFGWLWEQHALHHSDVSLNVTTNMRHHWLEPLLQAVVISLPMGLLFNMTPVTMWGVSMTIAAWTWFIHMNLRLPFGPFTRVLVGPQAHRIHHSVLPEHRDRNFAAYLPLWDLLFRTWYQPRPNEYPPTGIEGVRIRSLPMALVYPFLQWGRRLAAALTRKPAAD